MDRYNESNIQLINCGSQDCCDMHQWGPGMRPCYIIHYVIKGVGYLHCNGKKYRLEKGMSFLIYPFVNVRYYPDPKDPWEYTWVDFIGNEVSEYLAEGSFDQRKPVYPAIDSTTILPLYKRLLQLDLFYKNKQEANGLLITILGIYADILPSNNERTLPKEDFRLSTAIMLIHTNYHREPFYVDTICTLMHINRVTLYRLFQSKLGLSPSVYLLQYRLKQAKKLLLLDSSIKSTAISCGFSDPLYFSKVFKKHIGVAPSVFLANRNHMSNNENNDMSIELPKL